MRLIHELEKYRGMVPVLKYVRGEAFSDKHWIEMYNLLGIPSSTTIDKLTFGNFLQVRMDGWSFLLFNHYITVEGKIKKV